MVTTSIVKSNKLIEFSSQKTIDGKLCITREKAISIVNNPCGKGDDSSYNCLGKRELHWISRSATKPYKKRKEGMKKYIGCLHFTLHQNIGSKGIGTKLIK